MEHTKANSESQNYDYIVVAAAVVAVVAAVAVVAVVAVVVLVVVLVLLVVGVVVEGKNGAFAN